MFTEDFSPDSMLPRVDERVDLTALVGLDVGVGCQGT